MADDRDYRSKVGPWRIVGHNYTEFCCFCVVDEKVSYEIAARLISQWKRKQARKKRKLVKSLIKKVPLIAPLGNHLLPDLPPKRLN